MHVLTKVDDVHLCEEQCEEQQRHFVAKGAWLLGHEDKYANRNSIRSLACDIFGHWAQPNYRDTGQIDE